MIVPSRDGFVPRHDDLIPKTKNPAKAGFQYQEIVIDYTPNNNLAGSSSSCFTLTRKLTDSRPSIIR